MFPVSRLGGFGILPLLQKVGQEDRQKLLVLLDVPAPGSEHDEEGTTIQGQSPAQSSNLAFQSQSGLPQTPKC